MDDADPELQAALALSRAELPAPRHEDELERAIAASLLEAAPERTPSHASEDVLRALQLSQEEHTKDQKRRDLLRKQEDDSELFQAALRASRVDLGPRGISQAAKIMATGDEKLGQQALAKPKCASRQSSRGFKPDDSPGAWLGLVDPRGPPGVFIYLFIFFVGDDGFPS
ncbi:unnamed protein product [Effrenium voratum]|nr:unnamed protein product [Effrenium voratum]